MMSQNKKITTALLCTALLFFAVGCGGEEEKETQKVVQERPVAPPRPKARTIEQISESLSIDPRIQIEEHDAPKQEAQRIALLTFFDAMVRADADTLKSMMSFKDQLELDAMLNAGLASSMDEVSLVLIKTGLSPEGKQCVMAIYEIGLNYQVQLWFVDDNGQGSSFVSAETPPNLVEKLSGNWIDTYFEWKGKQTEIAQQPDEETSYALAGDDTSSSSNQGGGGNQGPGGQ